MKLAQPIAEIYSKEQKTALEAQRLAQEISFGPIVFQVSRLMVKFGIFEYLSNHYEGVSQQEVVMHTRLSNYAVQVLLEASLSIGTVLTKDDKFFLSKAGWFLLNDPMVKVNMDFNHDVNYLGLFYLEEALLEGRPAGLQVFGNWSTIYEGLSSLPEQVKKSWFAFDHFYSDESFAAALNIVFDGERPVKRLLDVGGNTGRWALRCVGYNREVEVTIMDLPQQLEMMYKQIAGKDGAERHRQDFMADKLGQIAVKMDEGVDAAADAEAGNDGGAATHPEGLPHEGAADEAPARTDELHGVDAETAGIDIHADGVVDEGERHAAQQGGNAQQHGADEGDDVVDAFDFLNGVDDLGADLFVLDCDLVACLSEAFDASVRAEVCESLLESGVVENSRTVEENDRLCVFGRHHFDRFCNAAVVLLLREERAVRFVLLVGLGNAYGLVEVSAV